ncbi:MAG: hypothetical protein ACK41T_02845 [Pseudobdellovibrio sp.]
MQGLNIKRLGSILVCLLGFTFFGYHLISQARASSYGQVNDLSDQGMFNQLDENVISNDIDSEHFTEMDQQDIDVLVKQLEKMDFKEMEGKLESMKKLNHLPVTDKNFMNSLNETLKKLEADLEKVDKKIESSRK